MGFSSLAGAGISGISSLLGAGQVAAGADKAAQAQAIAGTNAQNALTGALDTSTQQLSPYVGYGNNALGVLSNQLNGLITTAPTPNARYVDPSTYGTDPSGYATSGTANNISGTADNISADPYATTGDFTQADLEATPGYQFTLQQGEKGVQNSAAARGLGVSGAALKGAATYATGLSDQTYGTRFNQELGANAQNFGQAATAANTNFGQEATAATTNYGQQSGANEQNFQNVLGSNQAKASNALTAAGQNFGQDQTGFADTQAGNAQANNILTGSVGLGLNATGAQVGANTSTAIGTANALTGVGTAQAAADNATGQAYGAATTGVANALTGGIGNYNGYQIASSINPNIAGAGTIGNALTNALGGNNSFLNTVSGAVKNNSTGTAGGSMNV